MTLSEEQLAVIERYLRPYRDPSYHGRKLDDCADERVLRLAGHVIDLLAGLRASRERESALERERDEWRDKFWERGRAINIEADRADDAEARLAEARAAMENLIDPDSLYSVGTSTYAHKVLTRALAATAPAPAREGQGGLNDETARTSA